MAHRRVAPYRRRMALPAQPLTLASRPPAVPGGARSRHIVAAVALAGAALTLLFIVLAVLDVGGMRWLWENVHWTLSPVVGLVVVLVGARRATGLDRQIRLGMAGVIGLWLASQVAYVIHLAGPMPVPSVADVLVLATPIPVGVVLVAIARRRLSGAKLTALYLDCLAVCLAIAAVLVAIHPIAPDGDRWTARGILALAYPLAFLGSGGVALVAAFGVRAPVAARGIFLVSGGIFALGALFTVWMTGQDSGSALGQMAGYAMSLTLIGTAAGMASWRNAPETRPGRLRLSEVAQDVVPLTSLVAASAALLIPNVPEAPEEIILKVLAVATTLLLVARQTILLRERNSALVELRETHLQAETALRVNRELTELLQQRIVDMEGMHGQLVQASRQAAVGGLASALAHEVNNPLTGVLGYAELLLADLPSDGQGREELETIRNEALRARKIIRSLVEFARPRPPEQAPTDVNDVARNTIDLIRYHVERGGVEIRETYGDLPVMTVDQAALSQLLLNLFNNAIQSMPDGGTLRIASRVDEDRVAISVADDGRGMDEATLGRVFEPFFTTRNLDAGHGLGLPVAMGIAEGHGGTIEIVSQPGRGTIAEVRLPLSLAMPTTDDPPN